MYKTKGFKNYTSNTLWLLSEKACRLLFGFFVSVWVARYLGPEDFGLLNYSLSFVFLFSVFSNLGLDQVIIKEIVKKETSEKTILGTAITIKTLATLLLFYPLIFISLYIFDIDKNTHSLIYILSLGVFFQTLYIFDLYFQAKVKSRKSVSVFLFALILSNLLKIILIKAKLGVHYFSAVLTFEMAITAGGLSFLYLKGLKPGQLQAKFKFSKNLAKRLIQESWPLIISGLLVSVYMKIDQVMIGNMLTKKEVGEYAAALKFTEVWYNIPMTFCASLFPAIINAKINKGEREYFSRVEKLMSILVLPSILLSLIMTSISDIFIEFIYGGQYEQAASILQVHIWNSVFVTMGLVSGKWFVAEGLTRLTLRRSIIGCVANIILNYFLIPSYGGLGAAYATLISSSFSNLFSDLTHPLSRRLFLAKLRSLIGYSLWCK